MGVFSWMVHHRGKNLHTNSGTSVSTRVKHEAVTPRELLEELSRWKKILSVIYANYCLERGLSV